MQQIRNNCSAVADKRTGVSEKGGINDTVLVKVSSQHRRRLPRQEIALEVLNREDLLFGNPADFLLPQSLTIFADQQAVMEAGDKVEVLVHEKLAWKAGLLAYILPFFVMLAAMCIIFSTSIQDTERQLRIRNQTLYKEAGTDPLTGLPNRRAMIEAIEKFCKANPEESFAVAIADIDFFKNVNDTYGHNCGDYTLVKLTELFTEHSGGRYSVCRWGGEEFCFFMPGANIDDAGVIMHDVNFAVERMRLEFEGNEITITITIGVEECDFSSPLEDLLKRADEKLYMGKNSGRNKVVV